MAFDEYYDFRNQLVEYVRRDLVGYTERDEVIRDAPITQYIAGVLFPHNGHASREPDDHHIEQDDFDEEAPVDPPVAMANMRYPSSMGITFSVDSTSTKTIVAKIEAGRYEQVDCDAADQWRRIPIGPVSISIDIGSPVAGNRREIDDNLELFYRVRRSNKEGHISVTLVLLNTHTRPSRGIRDAYAFFQPSITVSGENATRAPFVGRQSKRITSDDVDIRSYQLLYRNATPIAIGHGCSVEWKDDPDTPDRAKQIETTFVPTHDLPLADSPSFDMSGLTMKDLAGGPRGPAITAMTEFCQRYCDWIEGLTHRLDEFGGGLRRTAKEHIEACRDALGRMKAGVDLLSKNDIAWQAFQLANEAMLHQRARSEWINRGSPTPGPDDESSEHKWYAFQLAFILVALRGIAEPTSDDRDVADLLWFPTGGGKTEAYMGLIAFTIFYRRLWHSADGDGVTVIMRYTMRLLTLQQFKRATILICCCESIRRKSSMLGRTPISIGLWVGKALSPNTLRDARQALNKIDNGQDVEESNPIQLSSCPWCGAPLGRRNYYITNNNPRLVINCRQQDCDFKNELPVFVVDEDIYHQRPTLLIATVDKFGNLPWRDDTGEIFNRGRTHNKPPELIVQDELHLISGPLGTLTGLYETAVDRLCTDEGVRAKVIASTATIRQAESQGRGLFNRVVKQFPPSGLDASDSFFAKEASRDRKGSRMYVGLMTSASQATLLVRVYAALLQAGKEIDVPDDLLRDAYWSLVGYFNSLRVLGSAQMQVQDDVAEDRIPLLARKSANDPRIIENRIVLSGRPEDGFIVDHLKRMERYPYPNPDALDVILATSAISVGVDVSRLGLMAVMGQPQSTSEYIQATSRVGRNYPGLVCVMFNAAKSRDRSHYESFVDFHSALYRQVESSSVTPFSSRARDRGLHAVLIALARLTSPSLTANDGASNVGDLLDHLNSVKQVILDRVAAASPKDINETRKQLDEIIEQWRHRAVQSPNLRFQDSHHPDRALLVEATNTDVDPEGWFPTLRSMRHVDPATNLYQIS